MRIKSSYHPIMIALAVLAGAGSLAACGSSRADEPYIATRCTQSGDHCWQVRCDDEGDNCYPVSYSYGSGDNNNAGHRSWVCNEDREDCHWVDGDSDRRQR
ncbi:MAG: hypothetical protein KGL26_14975 [Pseudomonadota bacterium]|nr:hypothetical protein [Pseudomonadota bacterium]